MFSMAKIMVEEKQGILTHSLPMHYQAQWLCIFFHHNLFVFHKREYLVYTLKLLQTEPSTFLYL